MSTFKTKLSQNKKCLECKNGESQPEKRLNCGNCKLRKGACLSKHF